MLTKMYLEKEVFVTSVLKATDKSTDEDVAVKIIKAKKSVIEQILFYKTSASIKQGRKEALILRPHKLEY